MCGDFGVEEGGDKIELYRLCFFDVVLCVVDGLKGGKNSCYS